MTLTKRLIVLLVAGVLGWSVATGVAIAAVTGISPQGTAGDPGATGVAGKAGSRGANGADSTKAGRRGATGAKGSTGNTGRRGAAYARKTHTVFSRSQTGNYAGSTVPVKAGVQLSVGYAFRCPSSSPFLSFTFDSKSDYENIWLSGTSGRDRQYLNPTEDSGTFSVTTQDNCSWNIVVTQWY